ncbi:Aromatic-amino-acid aminotransferase [Levilactobacillus brevis]|nr:Aromatic-amino-acid aminotransferase [Levilactobacillus brevis]
MNQGGQHLFQYHDVLGNPELRAQLAARIARTGGVSATQDNVVLTVGGQQGLEVIAKTVLNPGDDVIVEGPCYFGALGAFDLCEPTYHTVPLQADGVDLEQLEATLKQYPETKLFYTVPDYQNPTGVTMSVAKRQRLVALANQYDFVILEDSPYRDLGYTGAPLPTIKHFDTQGRVVFLSSFSKMLVPGLRVGWLVADGDLLAGIQKMLLASNLGAASVVQEALANYMKENDLDAHMVELKNHYHEQHDAMMAAIQKYVPGVVTVTHPTGGFYYWVTLPQGVDTTAILANIAAPQAHVTYIPSANFYPQHDVHNGLRLSYSGVTPAQIDAGMRRLGQVLETAIKRAQPVPEA